MSPVWDADHEIVEEGAAALIARQFPQLAPERIERMGVGWDNVAFQVNGRYVFRFPRRKVGADLILNEIRALPVIAPSLGLSVPVPRYVGRPHGDYPYPFAGYALIRGRTACEAVWTDAGRAEIAVSLGRFLAALHTIPITLETLAWAPRDEIRRADIPFRAAKVQDRLVALRALVPGVNVGALAALVGRLADTPPQPGPPCWVHGDLYARHLLVDERECLCGVIDWGDVHVGDPALDLSIVYSFLPTAARPAFWGAYGVVDEATRRRARFRAIHYGIILVAYGDDVGDAAIRRIGEYALRVGAE